MTDAGRNDRLWQRFIIRADMPYKDINKRKAYHKVYNKWYGQTEKSRLSHKRWRESEHGKLVARKYWQSEKSKTTAKKRHQSVEGKALMAARTKRWLNSEKGRLTRQRYRKTETAKKNVRRYNQSEKGRASKYRKLAKRRGLLNDTTCTLTAHEWSEILNAYKYRCAYCDASDVKLEQDHYIAISKGGTHTKNNVIPACITCNRKKHNRDPRRLF